ncbi:hypothetical protein GR254_05940 [Mycobacterium tuberculosis]|nr:hypothetical protein [Mycobacterium tuberculosis]
MMASNQTAAQHSSATLQQAPRSIDDAGGCPLTISPIANSPGDTFAVTPVVEYEPPPRNMTVWSYCDQFNLCVMADAVAVRNTWELVGGFRASHEELLAAARAQATPKEMAT